MPLVRRPTTEIGYLAPRLLLGIFLLDVGLRFVPLRYFTYRGWEAMTARSTFADWHVSEGPFAHEKTYSNESAYGDLAAMANRPDMRWYRRERFVTDEFGYRNAPGMTRRVPVSAVLVGDSFGVGADNSDGFTLADALRREGVSVYNAAGLFPSSLQDILYPIESIGLKEGWVICEYLERSETPFNLAGPSERWNIRLLKRVLSLLGPQNGLRLREGASRLFGVSPVKIMAAKFLKRFSDGWIFPNPYANTVVQRRVAGGGGDLMLFQRLEIGQYHRCRHCRALEVAPWTALFTSLSNELAKRHFKLMVLLVPEKYTVYEPLLEQGDLTAPEGPLYLDVMEKQLSAAGVHVVNLTQVFRKNVGRLAPMDIDLYWADDSHWAPAGIVLAAKELSRALKLADSRRTAGGT